MQSDEKEPIKELKNSISVRAHSGQNACAYLKFEFLLFQFIIYFKS